MEVLFIFQLTGRPEECSHQRDNPGPHGRRHQHERFHGLRHRRQARERNHNRYKSNKDLSYEEQRFA